MTGLLLAAALAGAPARAQGEPVVLGARDKPYGVLLLAFDVDVRWREELANLRRGLKGHAVESVDSADDAISIQRALDRLAAQRVGKIVAVPLDTVSDSARMDLLRYFFGVRQSPVLDVPGAGDGSFADKPLQSTTMRPVAKPTLVPTGSNADLPLPLGARATSTIRRLNSPVPLVLASAMDRSPVLAAILADRAKALTPLPARAALVLAGIAPRSDAALKAWKTAAQAVADQAGAKAGFRKAVAVWVRDGVRAGQQDADKQALRATMRGLIREGPVVVVPLSPESQRVDQLLRKSLGGFYAYRWDGRGVQGDRRLEDWIKASAAAAAQLPDGRRFKDGALGAPGGFQ